MACCGKKRRNEPRSVTDRAAARAAATSKRTAFSEATPGPPPGSSARYGAQSALPAESTGRIVKARYIGNRGAGPHYYRDPDTRHAYKVRHGVHIQADIADTCSQEDRDAGRSKKLLIRVEDPPPAPAPNPPPPPPPPPPPIPISGPPPKRSLADLVVQDLKPLPATIRELQVLVKEGQEQGQLLAWLEIEQGQEKPRITAIKLLEKAIG